MSDKTTKTSTAAVIRVLKFGGLSCPACLAMKRANTLERLHDYFPGTFELAEYNVNDAQGETPEGSKFAEHYALSDDYEVEALPTIIFEDAASGDELGRIEGGVGVRDLKKAAEAAIENRAGLEERRALSRKARGA